VESREQGPQEGDSGDAGAVMTSEADFYDALAALEPAGRERALLDFLLYGSVFIKGGKVIPATEVDYVEMRGVVR